MEKSINKCQLAIVLIFCQPDKKIDEERVFCGAAPMGSPVQIE